MALKDRLAEHGYEAVIFHSNGVGGRAMEELAETGHFVGVIDFTTNETFDPMTGGIHDGGPDRLKRIGLLGLPQVVVPGCIDFCVFHAGAIPPALQGRPVYDHNPEYTLVRATHAEMVALGPPFCRTPEPGQRAGSDRCPDPGPLHPQRTGRSILEPGSRRSLPGNPAQRDQERHPHSYL